MSELVDRANIKTGIVHFGVGRFHRAHEALYVNELLLQGNNNQWGICGILLLPYDENVYNILNNQNNIYHIIERNNNNVNIKKISSIIELIYNYNTNNYNKIFNKLISDDVKIVTFTLTEAGYYYYPHNKKLNRSHPSIQHDINNLNEPITIYGYLCYSLNKRKDLNIKSFTIQSCDNIQGNGDLTRSLLLEFCEIAYPNLVNWIINNTTFPNSMVDRITPAANNNEIDFIKNELNIVDNSPVTCEMYRQWVIEDNYCNDRPHWESINVLVTNNVKPYEKMKIRLLNAGHSALGYAGYLFGYTYIDEVASNQIFQLFLKNFFNEVIITLDTVNGINIADYQDILINRFSNNAIKDQVLRICKDGSAKIPGFIIPTLNDIISNNNTSYRCIAMVIACFIKYIETYSSTLNTTIPSNKLDDPEADKLIGLVEKAKGNVTLFIGDTALFGSLGSNTEVVSTIQECYDSITNNTIINAITKLIEK